MLDEDTDLVRLGKFYEKNGFKKVGENKYEYDPKAKDSSGDIGSSPNVGGAKESDITAGANKRQPSKNVGVQTQEELVETPAKQAVVVPQEGDIVELAPRLKGGLATIIEYKNGEWKQKIGNEYAEIGKSAKEEAQKAWESKQIKEEPINAIQEQEASSVPIQPKAEVS